MKRVFLYLFIFTAIFSFQPTFAQDKYSDWNRLETKYTTIFYEKDVDLRKVERKIRVSAVDISGARFSTHTSDTKTNLINKFDLLFTKAQQILDMYPSGVHVDVKICKRLSDLRNEYRKIFGESTKIISFYIFKFNTVYLCEETVHEGVAAHELSHAIIDHYFAILPPRRVQEILATYVDAHLED